MEPIKPVSIEEAEAWQKRLCCITSHPRSGSHWLRRMLGEVIANRVGYDLTFRNIDKYIGFGMVPVNNVMVKKHPYPLFYATHGYDDIPRIFLRRNFQDVLASCWKGEEDNQTLWFTGNQDEIRERWEKMMIFGSTHSEIIIDYDIMKHEPKAIISGVFKHLEMEVEDWELDQAVKAGSRENMLKEQQQCEKRTWDIVNEPNY